MLNGYGLADWSSIQAALSQQGENVVLTLDNGETVTFLNTTVASFSSDNFIVSYVTTSSVSCESNAAASGGSSASANPARSLYDLPLWLTVFWKEDF